jgi:plasmid stabilization system protein ParE
MNKKIEWSPRATKEYLNLIDYLLSEWGERTEKKFSERLKNILSYILENPEMYPATTKRNNIRRCIISKQTSLYYRIKRDEIELVTLFDTRQNISKKKL